MKMHCLCTLLAILLSTVVDSRAAMFGSGSNAFNIEFVQIGDPGNPADTSGNPNPAGAVEYVYQISKFEIPESAIELANAAAGLGITKDSRGPNKPATSINWYEAAQFVNWLSIGTGGAPAYKFDGNGNFELWEPGDEGYNPDNLFRNRLAHYALPSTDEWYKAAFYDPQTNEYFDYATSSSTPPIAVSSGILPGTAVYMGQAGPADVTMAGGLSPYGTMGQSGNVSEWEETEFDFTNDTIVSSRGLRSGSYFDDASEISSQFRFGDGASPFVGDGGDGGFRVVRLVPEPASSLLILSTFVMVSTVLPREQRSADFS